MPKKTPKQSWYSISPRMEASANPDEREVMIYDAIGDYGISAKDFISDLKALTPGTKSLRMRINSPGGSVFDGNAIYNELIDMGSKGMKIEAVIDGIAASMASIIAMAADKITMPANAVFFIHNPYTYSMGDADALRKDAALLDNLKKEAIKAYRRHAKDLSDSDVSEIMDSDTWMTAEEAKVYGFAEEVTEAREIDGSMLAKMKNVPENITKTIGSFKAALPAAAAVPLMSTQPITPTKGVSMKFDAHGNLVDDKGVIVMTAAQIKAGTPADESLVLAHKREIEEARQAAIKAENERITSITAMVEAAGKPDMLADLLKPEVSVADAQAKVLKVVLDSLKGTGTRVNVDETDKIRGGLVNAILVRGGKENDPKKVAEFRGSELAGIIGFQGMLRYLGKKAGVANAESCDCGKLFQALLGYDVAGIRPTMGMGMNTNDLNSVLSTAANSIVLKGYGEETTTYQRVSRNITLSDLKQADMYKTSGSPDVLEIPEGQPPKLGVISDKMEHAQLKKWGRAFSYTEEMAINDRLDQLTDLPYKFGRAIAREMNDRFWRTLLTNNGPTLVETGAAFFATVGAFANQAAAGAAISQATLSAAFVAMRRFPRLAPDGGQSRTTRLNMPPKLIVTGARSEWLVRQFTSNAYVPQTTPPANTNMLTDNLFRSGGSMGLEPVIESLIDDLIPATNAYLLAQDPMAIDHALTLSLAGRESPQTQSKLGGAGEVKGLIFDIEHFFEVAFVDWRGWYKNVGV